METKSDNIKLIERFLFGEMPDEERFGFEERFLTDQELFDQIRAAEDDLIEKYVRGWMTPVERSKFEQGFLTTKKRRERVRFARQLIETVRRETAVEANNEPAASVWSQIRGLFLTPGFALAGAVAVLAVVLGGWILYQNFGEGKPEVVKNQNINAPDAASPTPEKTPVPGDEPINPENSTEPAAEYPVNKDKADPTPENSKPAGTPLPAPTRTPLVRKRPANPVLALVAGINRSDGRINELNLPESSTGATLQLNLETVDYKTYRAELTDAEGRTIFQKDGLRVTGARVNFFVPAKNLRRGDYLIRLSGNTETGEAESVADFQFRVKE